MEGFRQHAIGITEAMHSLTTRHIIHLVPHPPTRPSRAHAEMKRPCLKYHAPPGARYKCSFPGCEKRYVSTDGVRKHARKRHAEWLAAVDEHSGLRDKAFESKPSTYCVMEYDDEDDVDGSEAGSASWRTESVPSDNESATPNDVACVPCVPVVAREVRAPPIGERLASIAMEMNAEAPMPTSLPYP